MFERRVHDNGRACSDIRTMAYAVSCAMIRDVAGPEYDRDYLEAHPCMSSDSLHPLFCRYLCGGKRRCGQPSIRIHPAVDHAEFARYCSPLGLCRFLLHL